MASVKIKREELLNKIQSVSAGLSNREVIEQSDSVCFQDGYIMTYNEEVACRLPSKLGNDFTGAVKAKPLFKLLSLQELGDDIEIETTETELQIFAKGGKEFAVRLEPDILLAIGTVETPKKSAWRDLSEEFTEAVQLVADCAGTDDARFNLTCIHITPKYIEACDNMQAMRYNVRIARNKTEKLETAVLARRDALKNICPLGMTKFAETEAWLHFKNPDGLIFSCRRHLEDYPDLASVVQADGRKTILPKGLADAIKMTEIFSEDNPDDNKVLIELTTGKIRVRGEGVTGRGKVPKKIKYKGPPVSFLISPKLLATITSRYNECEISEDKLKVDGGKFTYIACLAPSEKNGDDSKEEDEPEEEEEESEE